MDLNEQAVTARKLLNGDQKNIALTAGQRLVIETSPGGSEILDVAVPPGKSWIVGVGVQIEEHDA